MSVISGLEVGFGEDIYNGTFNPDQFAMAFSENIVPLSDSAINANFEFFKNYIFKAYASTLYTYYYI